MTLSNHLDNFYKQYNIPPNGGIDDKIFKVPFPYFTLTLPNFSWRKKMLYIHDLEHILNEQNTTWRGEMFIASWEISTGFWHHFPIIIFPLWTMGWGLWKHPTSVWKGFNAGNSSIGIANLGIEKEKLLKMNLLLLKKISQKKVLKKSKLSFYSKFIMWILISELVFLAPIFILLSTILYLFG